MPVLNRPGRCDRPGLHPSLRIMSSPEPLKDPDGKPLDPAAQAVVDRVRRMSMLSGFATLLGIAVVIVVFVWLVGFDATPARSETPAPQPHAVYIGEGPTLRIREGHWVTNDISMAKIFATYQECLQEASKFAGFHPVPHQAVLRPV